ncbi:MAG: TRAP transporter TatT component family protein [Myxococcales bacterium]
MFRSTFPLSIVLIGSLLPGCNVGRIAANSSTKVAEAGSEGINGFWDYEIFGQAVPGAILQSEALVRSSPNNEDLLLGLAKSYVSYAYGWVQDDWEQADDKGDFEKADRLEQRVMLLYKRAAQLGLRATHARDGGGQLREKLKARDLPALKTYLSQNFTNKEDAAALYWAGLAWGSQMANSGGSVADLADAPVARTLLERSVELDPGYADAGALGVLGTVEASFPELFGGNLEKAKGYYERALEVCNRRNHLILLSYAKTYAVAKQDRALFVELLMEILNAPDQGSDIRMVNKVARHRAERYIKKVDDWFDPALPPEPAEEAPEEAPQPEGKGPENLPQATAQGH